MRLPYSRSSIERVGHAVGGEYLGRRELVEPKLIETCGLPPGIGSVSVSVDRVTVPMGAAARGTKRHWAARAAPRRHATQVRARGLTVSAAGTGRGRASSKGRTA